MRLGASLAILALGIAISVGVYAATGGRMILFLLPLVFGLPLLWRRGGR